jgi:hypothetical protein
MKKVNIINWFYLDFNFYNIIKFVNYIFYVINLGKFAVESYLNVTRIMINPSIPEIIAFKERYIFDFVFYIIYLIHFRCIE